jgi:hypothetical protein
LSAITVAAAAALWVGVRRYTRERPVVGHQAQRLSAEDANTAAFGLAIAGQHQASLPYFRSVVSQTPTDFLAHQNDSTALSNAAQESRYHVGRLESATRSSVERVALMKTSLNESDLAESLARTPQDLARVISGRAKSLRTWGFPGEALAEFRRALALTRGDAGLARETRALALAVEVGVP